MTDFNTVIIGAGTAGLTAAIYTARKSKSVLVLESTGIGGQIATSPCVENYPGFESISGIEFSDKLYEQALSYGITLEFEQASKIEVNSEGKKFVYTENNQKKYSCEKIIIATGVKHRHLELEGEDTLSGVSYCAVCDGAFYKGKDVAVVGGGSSALQSTRLLSGLCNKVYLIHRRDSFRGEQKLADEIAKLPNVQFVLNSNITKLNGENQLSGITVTNKETGENTNISINGLFIYIGQIPQNEIFKSTVDLDENGYIVANEDCKTSLEGIFAVGDCRTKAVRQLTTAAADGTVAALAE